MHEKIFDKLCDILDDMERKDKLSASDIQIIDWATHAKKSMLATDEMMGDNPNYSNRRSYRDGYANRKRDSMGRYARTYRGGYSRGGKDEFLDEMRGMMDSAPDEMTRQSIQRMINQLEQD